MARALMAEASIATPNSGFTIYDIRFSRAGAEGAAVTTTAGNELAKSGFLRHTLGMSDKQVALETIQRMPESVSLDEITHRLEFIAAVQKGLDQIQSGEVVSHDQVKRDLASWLSK